MTVVEWLEQKLKTYCLLTISIKADFDKAKEMEKQQIIDFAIWFNNRNNEYQSYENIVKQYYNETFKK